MQDPKIDRYWKEIINTMNDGLMVVSPDGTILMVNQALEKIVGYGREELIGRSCALLSCDACATPVRKAKASGATSLNKGRPLVNPAC